MTPQRYEMREHVRQMTGLDDVSGIELISLLRMAANLSDALENRASGDEAVSAARFGLLLRLFVEERHGGRSGLTPTALSRFQNVSKNTISSLLRGLEEQGLIERALDAADLRLFRIQLTPAGRSLVQTKAPDRMRQLNELASSLTGHERELAITVLDKLCRSLFASLGCARSV
jgi:DNA-binding MarR family transcriptional regulator